MPITNKENCVVYWVKGVFRCLIFIIIFVAISCIYYSAKVGVYVFVISRDSDINRLLWKGGHNIGCIFIGDIKISNFDFGSIGDRVVTVDRVVTLSTWNIWVRALEHGIVVLKVYEGIKKVATFAAIIFAKIVALGRAVN